MTSRFVRHAAAGLFGLFCLLRAHLAGGQGVEPAPPGAIPEQAAANPLAVLMLTTHTQGIGVQVGQSRTLHVPERFSRVSVTEPKIADVQVMDVNHLTLMGKSPGITDLTLWTSDEKIKHVRVEVDPDLERLQRDLTGLFPNSKLTLGHTQGVFVMTGTVEDAAQAEQVQKMMEQMGIKFINLAKLPGPQQVQLKVRVAEVSRSGLRLLGINALKGGEDFFGGLLLGPASGGTVNPVTIGPAKGALASAKHIPFVFPNDAQVSPAVTVLAGFPDSDLELFIQALAENQYLRILAEPTLIALSGEEARFLAGGEFPIPVVQGSTVGGISITIDYKEFGVRLRFLPTVMGDGAIRMRVEPEVSNLSDIGAVEIQGFRVPSLLTRRAETTLELKSGQSFAIAGLINQTEVGTNSRLPFLGDIPLVGALFRVNRHEAQDAELMVLVKAELVAPMDQEPPVPGENARRPDDWEFYSLGQLEGSGSEMLSPQAEQWLRSHGWDRLNGPGAWQSQGAPASTAAPPAGPPPAVPTP